MTTNKSHVWKMAFLFTGSKYIGLVLSFWFGLGWLALGFFGVKAIIYIPEIYIPFLDKLFGTEVAEFEKQKLSDKKHLWVRRSVGLLYIALIILVFWEFNIPLLELGH